MSILTDLWHAADDVFGAVGTGFHTLEELMNPGGDPDALFAAAAATAKLASGISDTTAALGQAAAGLESSWRGLGQSQDTSAAAAYQRNWARFRNAAAEWTVSLDDQAVPSIRSLGSYLERAQSLAAKARIVAGIDAAAIGIATIVTAGAGDAIELAMAETEVAVLGAEATALQVFIVDALAILDRVVDAFLAVSLNFSLGIASAAAAVVYQKWLQGVDPWNPDSYDPGDISNALLDGLAYVSLGLASNNIAVLKSFASANPAFFSAVWNATGAFGWGVAWDFGIQDKSPLDWGPWNGILDSAGASFVLAPVMRTLAGAPGVRVLFPKGEIMPGLTGSDITNGVIASPITGIKLRLFTGVPPPAVSSGPASGQAPDAEPTPDLPVLPQVPAHIGGGTYTVASGDTLYGIAAKHLNNPNLYPVLQAANPLAVGADGTIYPGSHLRIPVLPEVPAGSTAHVVQPGETLSQIAGGDTALQDKIAELNGIKNQSLIYGGQVIIVPPSG